MHYVQNPGKPSDNCYIDAKWSPTKGAFVSKEACEVHLEQLATEEQVSQKKKKNSIAIALDSPPPLPVEVEDEDDDDILSTLPVRSPSKTNL